MVPIDLVYEGQLRVRATHGPSQTVLSTDAPVDNHGRGETYSPTDLVATALGACVMTIMGIAAEPRNISLSGLRARIEKHMTTEGPRRISRLAVTVTMPAGLSAPDRRLLEACLESCPVRRSLHPDIEIPVRFEYLD